jgi:hypothetical protein
MDANRREKNPNWFLKKYTDIANFGNFVKI